MYLYVLTISHTPNVHQPGVKQTKTKIDNKQTNFLEIESIEYNYEDTISFDLIK